MSKDFEAKPTRSLAQQQETVKLTPEVAFKNETNVEERPFFGEFHGGKVDTVGEYIKPTAEQREKFQKRIERLSEIFENANFQWYLDGASNISLYNNDDDEGGQIRDHKDLDISVFKEDLVKLDELLSRQGFGIFINFNKNNKQLMKRVTVEELLTFDNPYLSICKIGPKGKIQKETFDHFNFVDLHVNSKDAEGNTIISYNGATLPKEFFDSVKKKLPNGKTINLSQPAIVAYYKLYFNRPYDLMDLEKLGPYLQKEDFLMLREDLVKKNEKIKEEMIRKKLQEAWGSLSLIWKSTRNQKVISEKLWKHPVFQKRKNNQKVSEFIVLISEYISKNLKITFDDFFNQLMAILNLRKQVEQKIKFIDKLEKKFIDQARKDIAIHY